MTHLPPPNPKKRPLYKSWRFWSLAFLALIIIAAVGSYFLATRVPDWYQPLDSHDQTVQLTAIRYRDIDSKAEFKKLDMVSPGHPVTVTLTEQEINSVAVVAVAENPQARVEQPVVLFQNGRITVGIKVNKVPVIGSGVLNFSVHFVLSPPENPAADAATRCTVVLDSASVGNLPIPRRTLLDRLPDLAPVIERAIKLEAIEKTPRDHLQQITEFLRLLAAEKAARIPFEYPGGLNGKSKRNVYLQSIHIADHKLSLTFAAEPLAP